MTNPTDNSALVVTQEMLWASADILSAWDANFETESSVLKRIYLVMVGQVQPNACDRTFLAPTVDQQTLQLSS